MSKSQGSAFSLEDIENKGFNSISLRYFFLQANYRSKQNFTFEALKAAQKGLTIIYNKIKKLETVIGEVNVDFKNKFLDYLLDNFNTPKTLSLISEILKSDLSNEDKLATLLDFDNIWALDFAKIINNDEKDTSLSDDIKKLLADREEARKNKDFTKADKVRIEIEKLGYKIEDLPDGRGIAVKI